MSQEIEKISHPQGTKLAELNTDHLKQVRDSAKITHDIVRDMLFFIYLY